MLSLKLLSLLFLYLCCWNLYMFTDLFCNSNPLHPFAVDCGPKLDQHILRDKIKILELSIKINIFR